MAVKDEQAMQSTAVKFANTTRSGQEGPQNVGIQGASRLTEESVRGRPGVHPIAVPRDQSLD